jgi:raffinose/stachyose/melibiose transport system permease protein
MRVAWMLVPALVIYVVFAIIPVIESLRISLYDWHGLGPMTDFVGLANYVAILVGPTLSPRFWPALLHNLVILTFGIVTLQVPAMALALLLWRRKAPLSALLRTLYLIPWAMAPAVVATLGQLMLDPEHGAVNELLQAVGLGGLIRPWLGDPTFALPAIILLGNWIVLGFIVLIYLAALRAIPAEILEASRIDGATHARTIWHVVLPLLRPTILTMIGLGIISSFSYFEMVYLVTGVDGGPFYATDVLATFFYRTTFGGNFGYGGSFGAGAAIATLMVLIVIPSSIAVIRLRRRYDVGY